ncbi:MAG: sporulation protein YtfJ [Clostridia bacterium]|nr:sporulation protein YtfJ [Clostridia bacterium]
MAEQNKMQEMIRTSLESIRTMVDANTVVGTPIETPAGTTIIPISKVSVGYASGGLDSVKVEQKKSFAGGGGTGLTVQPVCFLAVHVDGNVEMIPLGGGGGGVAPDKLDRIADLVEKTPDWLARIKAVFSKKKKDEEIEELVDTVADAAAEAAAEVMAEKIEQDEK